MNCYTTSNLKYLSAYTCDFRLSRYVDVKQPGLTAVSPSPSDIPESYKNIEIMYNRNKLHNVVIDVVDLFPKSLTQQDGHI